MNTVATQLGKLVYEVTRQQYERLIARLKDSADIRVIETVDGGELQIRTLLGQVAASYRYSEGRLTIAEVTLGGSTPIPIQAIHRAIRNYIQRSEAAPGNSEAIV